MGQPANRRRLFLHEVVLSLHQSGAEALSCDLGKNGAERQPGDVLGAGEIRCKNARAENRFEAAAVENQHGCGTWRRFWTLRLSPRNRPRLRFPPNPIMSGFLIGLGGKRNRGRFRGDSRSVQKRRHVPHPCWFSTAAAANPFSACAFLQRISPAPSTSPGCRSAPFLPRSQDKASAPDWCRGNTTSCKNNLLRFAGCPILRIRRWSAEETRRAWCSTRRRRARG